MYIYIHSCSKCIDSSICRRHDTCSFYSNKNLKTLETNINVAFRASRICLKQTNSNKRKFSPAHIQH